MPENQDAAGSALLKVPRVIDRCANITCPNRAHEGKMMTVYLGEAQHRPVLVVLCAPCAQATC